MIALVHWAAMNMHLLSKARGAQAENDDLAT
jgi:hypothetical protein